MNNLPKLSTAQFKIAELIGARPADVEEVGPKEVLQALSGSIHPHVLEVATEIVGARYWQFGTKFFLDDPEEEGPINFEDLRYDSVVGLHSVDEIDEWIRLGLR